MREKVTQKSRMPLRRSADRAPLKSLSFPLPRRNHNPNYELLPSLLCKLNENQLALEATLMEQPLWVEPRGSEDVADNVRRALREDAQSILCAWSN